MSLRILPLLLLVLFAAPAGATQSLPVVEDLRAEARQAEAAGVPILLLVSSEHCSYCRLVEENFLGPMSGNPGYRDKVLIRRLDLGRSVVRDFDGTSTSPRQLATRYGATLTPTVLFLNARGEEIAPRIVGIANEYFYGGELDEGIDAARSRLQKPDLTAAAAGAPQPGVDG